MIIGITGSIASGKTTASNIISKNKGPLFCADNIVRSLYKNKAFKKKVAKNFGLKLTKNLKATIKNKLHNNRKLLSKLEKIIHPLVRNKMKSFIKKYKNKKFIFLEIPLLVESNLSRYFDLIIFIKSNKNIRLRRFLKKGGNKKMFEFLNNHQLNDKKKSKFCDQIVVNNKSISVLKKRLFNIMLKYE